MILSEASDEGMPSDDVVPSEAVICSTFSAAVAFSSLFSLHFNTSQFARKTHTSKFVYENENLYKKICEVIVMCILFITDKKI